MSYHFENCSFYLRPLFLLYQFAMITYTIGFVMQYMFSLQYVEILAFSELLPAAALVKTLTEMQQRKLLILKIEESKVMNTFVWSKNYHRQ